MTDIKENPKCFKCGKFMVLLQAANGLFWVCEGPHFDGLWKAFRAEEKDRMTWL